MARSLLILALMTGCCFMAAGQPVTIKGKVDSSYLQDGNFFLFDPHWIFARTYQDHISYDTEKQVSVMLDRNGEFSLNIPLSKPGLVFLTVDNARAEMAVEPGQTYEVNFLAKDSNAVNTLAIPVPVGLEFLNSDREELNFLMADFTSRYEAFLEDHRGMIARKDGRIMGKIDTMKTLSIKKYGPYNNAYLDNFIEYTFAGLEESISLKGREKIFRNYLENKKVQLDNYDYMTFFHQFYASVSNDLMVSPKTQAEFSKKSFSALMEHFRANVFLSNDTIREAVILKSISEYSRYPSLRAAHVLEILDQAAAQCRSELNRKSAASLKRKLSAMLVGAPAPSTAFKDMNGKSVSLSDFKGKYVYLIFWTSWCTACSQEMMLIPELKKKYGNKVAFVTVSIDRSPDIVKGFVAKNPKVDWSFLWCDSYTEVKEDFKVLSVPAYYLIDPKGNVFRSPAGKPQDIEPVFMQIRKRR